MTPEVLPWCESQLAMHSTSVPGCAPCFHPVETTSQHMGHHSSSRLLYLLIRSEVLLLNALMQAQAGYSKLDFSLREQGILSFVHPLIF